MCECLACLLPSFSYFYQPFSSLHIFFSFLLCIILKRTFCIHSLLICGPYWVPFKTCRYKSLRDPLQERRGSLEASRLQYQFFRDVDEELTWVREKLPMASSRDYGQSLATVQSLQEKHQVKSCENHCQSLESKENTEFNLPQANFICCALATGVMMPGITLILFL